MHLLIALVTLLLSAAGMLAQQAGTSPVKIFILAGQSNMLGQGNMSPATTQGTLEYIVANDPGNDYQFLVDDGGNWVVRDDVWIKDQDPSYGGLTVGYGSNSGTVGPELGFGHFAGDHYENQVLIVKAAWGGKSLAVDFRPPSSDGTTGFYYNETLSLVNDAIANLGTYFPDYDADGVYEIAGFGWHQGWNDRVDAENSAEYETNMANFIRDIRSDLGVPDLPFVIATTGMDGGATYTVVEQAQLAMANTTAYPEFNDNVAVIDTRISYDGMDFWQPVDRSPADQGYHWNRNAKTYVNIGLAIGDAMSTMASSRCPSRLRATGGPGGVTLTWQNGIEIPTSVQVLRNSVEIAATAPVSPATFLDADAQPGVLDYEFIFTMPDAPCDPLTVTFDGGITGLEAFRSPDGVGLTWSNNMTYTAIEVRRNDAVIEAALSGTAETHTDTSPPASGLVTYTVVPTNGSAAPTEVQINLDGPPTGNAVIYEPFDYAIGGLNLQAGSSEVGLDGAWNANGTTVVTAGTLSYGDLPVGGAKLSDFTGSQNRFGGTRAIRTSALADNDLLDDGATLWFSALMGLQEGANRTNSSLGFALAAGPFGGGNGDWFISGGTGIGLRMGAGKPTAALFPADSGGATLGSFTGHQYVVPEYGLIVGKITWGATPGDLDTIELFQPDPDLVQPLSSISTLTTTVDQSTFDTLTFRRGDKPVLDEIRFGVSYNDVIGADLIAPDDTPPTPSPMTWERAPAAAGDTQVTMTATTATDPGGVEYYFEETSGTPGGNDSDWQNSSTYTDSGLSASTSYSYRVKARDKSTNANETDWSSTGSATTTAPDNTAPTPNPMTWASVPAATSVSEITMTASTASDPSGVEYKFTNLTVIDGSHDSGWQDRPTYTDTGLDPSTTYSYQVGARDQSSAANENTVSDTAAATTPDLPSGPGGALLYEPFDYDAGNISGNEGGTGFSGAWASTRNDPTVAAPGKTWGSLTTAGNYARGAAWSGLIRPIGSTLADARLMADGTTLWFSVIFDLEGQNTSNADINIALGTDQFVSGTFGDRENLVGGEGIGATHSGATIQGVYWQDNDADPVAERTENNSSTVINGSGGNLTRALIVGKIDWGATSGDSETLTLYAPGADLAIGVPTMEAWTIPALDQSLFNSLAIQFKDNSQVDEIRFGASYEDVIGMGGGNDYDDWADKYPGADLSDPDADFDGDGLTNNEERAWGLDPTSAASINPYAIPLSANGTFSYTRRDPALSGFTYTVWTSTDLQVWTEDTSAGQVPDTPDGNEVETVAVTLSPGAVDVPKLFIQVRAAE